jgi:hypothetical protein
MQSNLLDFLLNAYLTDHSSSIDVSHLKLSNSISTRNVLASLEKIYLTIQPSLNTKTIDHRNQQEQTTNTTNDSERVDQIRDNVPSSITITVCDEVKNLKRQFSCNRALLIRQMRYFADYLTDDPEQAEDVDISVHCDLDIFQWLISFVNRHTTGKTPQLEPRIAVSILISSDFLKMDELVVDSMNYIHDHINEILINHSNGLSIPDPIFRRLASLFDDPYHIEQIHDRKNKIRSKLFEHHLECLLNTAKIVRCQHCLNVMSVEHMELLSCQADRLIIRHTGKLCFQHQIDTKFDVNHWIRDIHTNGDNSWRHTFWIVW